MDKKYKTSNETLTAEAFSAQSIKFDQLYGLDKIIQYKRQRVRNHVEKLLLPNSNILELNAGTGEDAIFFASKGHLVHAIDISKGMLQVLSEKIEYFENKENISFELCSFTALNELQNKGPFDVIFSNFAGLNCTNEIDKVFAYFDNLLKPKGKVVLVMLPDFCLWEIFLLFRGQFKTAFRRFFSSKGAKASIEGKSFTCWYYQPNYIIRRLSEKFELIDLEGLCSLVPPNYYVNFPNKFPKLLKFLMRVEVNNCRKWPWKYIGDYYIISLKKK